MISLSPELTEAYSRNRPEAHVVLGQVAAKGDLVIASVGCDRVLAIIADRGGSRRDLACMVAGIEMNGPALDRLPFQDNDPGDGCLVELSRWVCRQQPVLAAKPSYQSLRRHCETIMASFRRQEDKCRQWCRDSRDTRLGHGAFP